MGESNDENYYHVFNRGVEKRPIFLKSRDYERFMHNLYEFNDTSPAPTNNRGTTSIVKKRDPLVEIVCFCLVPNHFHLILRSIKENGVTQFMIKLGTGYAMYFNIKHDRVGSLFQGRFKSVLIETDEQFMHLSRYIHLNPVELIEPKFKERGISDHKRVRNFLKNYPYSSYAECTDGKSQSSITSKEILLDYFGSSPKAYQQFVEDFLIDDIEILGKVSIDH